MILVRFLFVKPRILYTQLLSMHDCFDSSHSVKNCNWGFLHHPTTLLFLLRALFMPLLITHDLQATVGMENYINRARLQAFWCIHFKCSIAALFRLFISNSVSVSNSKSNGTASRWNIYFQLTFLPLLDIFADAYYGGVFEYHASPRKYSPDILWQIPGIMTNLNAKFLQPVWVQETEPNKAYFWEAVNAFVKHSALHYIYHSLFSSPWHLTNLFNYEHI